jgi:hypothetical protein
MDRRENLLIAEKLVVKNAGGPNKSGSPSTHFYNDKILLKKTQNNASLIYPYPNLFINYGFDCSKLPFGYYCFIVENVDPYTHCLIMHKNIPIFWFIVPTSSTNKLYELVSFESIYQRQGIKLNDLRAKLNKKMTPKPSRAKSKGEDYLEKFAQQIFNAWPVQIKQCFEKQGLLHKSVELYTYPKPSLLDAEDDLKNTIYQLAVHGQKKDGKSGGIIIDGKKKQKSNPFQHEFRDLWLILANKLISSTSSDPYILFSLYRTQSIQGSKHRPPSWFFITKDGWCVIMTHNTHASHIKDIPEYSFSAKNFDCQVDDPYFIDYLGIIVYKSYYQDWKKSFHYPLLIKGTGDIQYFWWYDETGRRLYEKIDKNQDHYSNVTTNYPELLSKGKKDYFMIPIPDYIRKQFSDKLDVFDILYFIYFELEQLKKLL